MMTEETRISKEIYDYSLKHKIWQLARYQAQASLNGIPDRLFLYKGVLIGVEVKTPTGKPTELQKRKLKMINENGGFGILVDDVDQFKGVIAYIDRVEHMEFGFWGWDMAIEQYELKYPHLALKEKER
jgi:hypothetical protein